MNRFSAFAQPQLRFTTVFVRFTTLLELELHGTVFPLSKVSAILTLGVLHCRLRTISNRNLVHPRTSPGPRSSAAGAKLAMRSINCCCDAKH